MHHARCGDRQRSIGICLVLDAAEADTRRTEALGELVHVGTGLAGGAASDGGRPILDLQPRSLHERTPLFLGSEADVRECEEFIQGKHAGVTMDRRIGSPVRASD